ncbi:MAG: hypothetical protein ACRDSL_14355 [Pseudonocardiaceae bacterium]
MGESLAAGSELLGQVREDHEAAAGRTHSAHVSAEHDPWHGASPDDNLT